MVERQIKPVEQEGIYFSYYKQGGGRGAPLILIRKSYAFCSILINQHQSSFKEVQESSFCSKLQLF